MPTQTRTNVKSLPEVAHALRSIVFRLDAVEGTLFSSDEKQGLLDLIEAAATPRETDFGIRSVLIVSEDTELKKTDDLVFVDTSTRDIIITLSAAASRKGKQYDIKNIGSSEHTFTVDAHEAETIDGGLTAVVTDRQECITVVSDGSNWHVI